MQVFFPYFFDFFPNILHRGGKRAIIVNEVRALAGIYTASLTELVRKFNMVPLYRSTDYESVQITVSDISRPGLQLAGFFDHFEPMRVYVLGTVEYTYLQKLDSENRTRIFDRFFSYKIPAVVFARGYDPMPECLQMAEKHDVTVLQSCEVTSYLISSMITSLQTDLAPRMTQHGVLVEIYGEGILITGDSGIGKSEAAIELVKRGHRLIADDAVEIKRVSPTTLIGSAPDVIRHYIEIRGIGVINVAKLFGIGAVKDNAQIDLVVHIEPWKTGVAYDRMGLDEAHINLLDVELPHITVPVQPGRNLAVIFEVAAMNNRQKKMGTNAAMEFAAQLQDTFGKTV
ncbi:MAG: HPr(Ser) kinase/phosphatase [Oscillospiraceae bacterium]|nr:HPr(Ser) kinase/phosphatase [Oscillospiraceae bacterium]